MAKTLRNNRSMTSANYGKFKVKGVSRKTRCISSSRCISKVLDSAVLPM